MNKIPVHIKVTGMGMCINYEMQIIQKALEAAGFEVIIKNKYPDEERNITDRIVNPNNWVIHLEANHQPWGG